MIWSGLIRELLIPDLCTLTYFVVVCVVVCGGLRWFVVFSAIHMYTSVTDLVNI